MALIKMEVTCKSWAAAAVQMTVVWLFLSRVCSDVGTKTMCKPKTRPPFSLYFTVGNLQPGPVCSLDHLVICKNGKF